VIDLATLWPHQLYALEEIPRRIAAGERRICLTSPTGGGKTKCLIGLIEWAVENDWQAVLYTNRKLLIDQLVGVLSQHGIRFGVRSADYEDDLDQPVQISSLPTENARVFKRGKWKIHGNGRPTLALVDEFHLNKGAVAQKVVDEHIKSGGAFVGVTATPIDVGHMADTLVVAGTPSELRECGALAPAFHYGPDEPDMRGFKQNVKTGEYTEGDVRKAIMTKAIFGRVLEHYRLYNPDQRPTILFAPGVAESMWFAEELTRAGIRSAHIDGTGYWLDGHFQHTTDRRHLLKACREGDIKILSNRFVLREGLDLPEISHLIFATVMGALQTYLQAGGRALRACKGKTRATIQDHGAHYLRHGSINMDRQWNLSYTEGMLATLRADEFRTHGEAEPICCPQCGLVRKSGPVCPQCHHQCDKRIRRVIQQDGTLKEQVGSYFGERIERCKDNTAQLWRSYYFRAKRSRNHMTFNQARALFVHERHYWPPKNLPLMPMHPLDWYRKVCEVETSRLYPQEQEARREAVPLLW
jgi:superfamily II DNA or RNA helicase